VDVIDKVRATLAATTGAITLVVYHALRSRDIGSGAAVLIALAASICAALAIDALLFGYGLRFRSARKMLLKTGKYEGTWFVEHDDLDQHSLATISSVDGVVSYQGIGVETTSGRICVVWQSTDIAFSIESGRFRYAFEARVQGEPYRVGEGPASQSRLLRGYGILAFNEEVRGEPHTGLDTYIDIDSDPSVESMKASEHWGRMHRVPRGLIRSTIGRRKCRTDRERVRVLEAAREEFCTCDREPSTTSAHTASAHTAS